MSKLFDGSYDNNIVKDADEGTLNLFNGERYKMLHFLNMPLSKDFWFLQLLNCQVTAPGEGSLWSPKEDYCYPELPHGAW